MSWPVKYWRELLGVSFCFAAIGLLALLGEISSACGR